MTVPAITRTTVRGLTQTDVEVRWVVEAHDEAPESFQYVVQRSEGSEGPWDTIHPTPLVDTFLFLDSRVSQHSKLRHPYYRVRIERVADPTDLFEGPPTVRMAPPSLWLEEIQRRYQEIGFPRYFGDWTALFIERTFGQRCPDCWDERKKRSCDDNCTTCFATGYVNGYMNQVNVWVQYTPEVQVSGIQELGEVQPVKGDAWMGNSPLLKPRDILIRSSDAKRFRVKNVRSTKHRGYVSRQVMDLVELDKANTEYNLAVAEIEPPDDPFFGFYGPNTPGVWGGSPDRLEGSGLL